MIKMEMVNIFKFIVKIYLMVSFLRLCKEKMAILDMVHVMHLFDYLLKLYYSKLNKGNIQWETMLMKYEIGGVHQ